MAIQQVYKFRLVSPELKDFYRDFEIETTCTFFDLHDFIQNEVGFDKSQLASFFIADSNWSKGKEISLLDMRTKNQKEPLVMDETSLNTLIKKVKDKLIYVFDFFSGRAFLIELLEIKEKDKLKRYPICVAGNGEPPAQIKFETSKRETIYKGPLLDNDEEEENEVIDSSEFDDEDEFDEEENEKEETDDKYF